MSVSHPLSSYDPIYVADVWNGIDVTTITIMAVREKLSKLKEHSISLLVADFESLGMSQCLDFITAMGEVLLFPQLHEVPPNEKALIKQMARLCLQTLQCLQDNSEDRASVYKMFEQEADFAWFLD